MALRDCCQWTCPQEQKPPLQTPDAAFLCSYGITVEAEFPRPEQPTLSHPSHVLLNETSLSSELQGSIFSLQQSISLVLPAAKPPHPHMPPLLEEDSPWTAQETHAELMQVPLTATLLKARPGEVWDKN